jgi:4-hydroxy-3-methylbut-2-enyl diphosphate reductase
VILPAFGVSVQELAELDRQGCTLVDTTCGSVLNVWKNVRRYAQEGFTSVIHGKVHHEETRATASQATAYPDGHYLIVRDREEAAMACDTSATAATARRSFAFEHAMSPVSTRTATCSASAARTDDHAQFQVARIGELFARPASVLARRSCHRGSALTAPSAAPRGPPGRGAGLLDEQPLDLMLVLGGYNSGNTFNEDLRGADDLAFHIADPTSLVSAGEILHRPVDASSETTAQHWLPEGRVRVGRPRAHRRRTTW